MSNPIGSNDTSPVGSNPAPAASGAEGSIVGGGWPARLDPAGLDTFHRAVTGVPLTSTSVQDRLHAAAAADVLLFLLRSQAFQERVVQPLLEGTPLASVFGRRSVPEEVVSFVTDVLGVQPSTAVRLAQPAQWPGFLSALFEDEAFRRALDQADPELAAGPFLTSLAARAASTGFPPAAQHDYDLVSAAEEFDAGFYLDSYPDIRAADCDPVEHYIGWGAYEGRNPGPGFSTAGYWHDHPDVAAANANPLLHYLWAGKGEGRRVRRADVPQPQPPGGPPSQVDAPSGPAWAADFARRLGERMEALAGMDLAPPFPVPFSAPVPAEKPKRSAKRRPQPASPAVPTFSVIMTVYDTPASYLDELAGCMAAQAFRDFEWLILDNGSRLPETIEACRRIAEGDERVTLFTVPENLHIIGGNRHVFEQARGHYVVPIDSDDLVYPDALALFADLLRREAADPPKVIYSDEQKVDADGQPLQLIWRRPFSLAHAAATAPAAHLMAFSREAGQEAGVYTEDYARGSHDWDTTMRIAERGGWVAHVPEVLYGWRVHPQSTAGSSDAKSDIGLSQAEVNTQSMTRRGLGEKFESVPLFAPSLDWYRQRRTLQDQPRVSIDYVLEFPVWNNEALSHNLAMSAGLNAASRLLYPAALSRLMEGVREALGAAAPSRWEAYDGPEALSRALNEVDEDAFAKVILSCDVCLEHEDGLRDGIGTLEQDPRAGVVGGMLVLDGRINSAGLLAGLDGTVGSPFRGCPVASAPLHLLLVDQPVTALPAKALVIRAELLRRGLRLDGLDTRNSMRGTRLGLACHDLGFQVAYCGRMSGAIAYDLPILAGLRPEEKQALAAALAAARTGSRDAFTHSGHLSRETQRFGQLRSPQEQGMAPGFETWRFAPAVPLNLRVDPALAGRPTINLLLPGIRMTAMSGGPNTALSIGYRLAAAGFAVRLFSTDVPTDADLGPAWRHIVKLGDGSGKPGHLTCVDASDRSRPTSIGPGDIFFATAWWTAQMAQYASALVERRPFIYLIQDFEPILYPASSHSAQAEETYGFDHVPIVNTRLLLDYLLEHRIGLFAEPAHAGRAVAFEPAVDRTQFYVQPGRGGRRTLLFYARPENGIRNLFQLGLAALQSAVADGTLDPEEWRFVGMGEAFAPVPLGHGAVLECAPWWSFAEYAAAMRGADILLSPMLSPHPSYPPLEMAACGGLVVTTVSANKTAERMAAISANILAVRPTVPGLVEGLRSAVARLPDQAARVAAAGIDLPATWEDSLRDVLSGLGRYLVESGVRPEAAGWPPAHEPARLGMPKADDPAYAAFLQTRLQRRMARHGGHQVPGLLCFVTTVWNTAPAFLDVLARSVHDQVGGTRFDWYVLDNGTTRADTRAFLAKLAERPYVKLVRVEQNLGIIGGMRHCLLNAGGRYILPLDSDDYLFPDCVATVTRAILDHGHPPLLYTDEDHLIDDRLIIPYLKPDWDPVLFVNSCYIAHLCALDRERALELGAYSDPVTEGSHDWDTFTRFLNAGHRPVHVPELLYSWRMHPQSTASNIDSKPVVYESQLGVLRRFLGARPGGERFEIRRSPLFGGTPDWWFRRRRVDPRPLTTILVRAGSDGGRPAPAPLADHRDHQMVSVGLHDPGTLAAVVRDCAGSGRLVHLLASEAEPEDDEWFWEALGHFELFPDTAMVGGVITSYGTVLAAGQFLGFGDGFGCPDRGRAVGDVGYSAQMFKQHSVGAVSAMHAVAEPVFLLEALEALAAQEPSIAYLGEWLGGYAAERGRRVVFSPLIRANTGIDWSQVADPRERQRLLRRFGHLGRDVRLRSPWFGTTPATAYLPVNGADAGPVLLGPDRFGYAEWFAQELRQRSLVPAEPRAAAVSFSVLTTLYSGSDAALFRLTARSVLEQSHAGFEWVVLTHGPITPNLDAALRELQADRRVRLLRLPENLGIMGGMRHVLQAAECEYILPMDGDDLLTPDCLALLAAEIVAGGEERPAYLYTDEDIVVGDALQSPYLRPDWDPVLDLESSWIWHTTAFRRDLALALEVYTDPGSEYCHDWDTLHRFAHAGHMPRHLRTVTYHWRHHAQSTSNSSNPDQGSSRSVRHLLGRKIADRGMEGRYAVVPYPIWRGAPEWGIRLAVAPEPAAVFTMADGAASEGATVLPRAGLVAAFRNAVRELDGAAVVMFAGPNLVRHDPDSLLEAVKLLELVADVAVVSGRVFDGSRVVDAGLSTHETGALTAPWAGRTASDAGAYALGWKPQAISVPAGEFWFARAGFLQEALAACPDHLGMADLAVWLGLFAQGAGRLVAFSPLVVGEAVPGWDGAGNAEDAARAWRFHAPAAVRRGEAGYVGVPFG